MQQLTQQEITQVSGGEGGFNLVFVSVNIPNPTLSPAITNLVERLMNGQMDAGTFTQALADLGGNLVHYMAVTPAYPN